MLNIKMTKIMSTNMLSELTVEGEDVKMVHNLFSWAQE